MKQLKDRVLEVSQTQGTGDYALAGAVTGFRAFSPAVNVGDTADYYAEEVDGTGVPSGAWETGMGTYAAGNKLQRTTIYASSNGGTPINWGVGTRRVAISLTSQTLADAVNSAEIASGYAAAANAAKVAAQAAAAAAAASAATLDLSAPNPIGNATPNTGAFTELNAQNGLVVGAAGATDGVVVLKRGSDGLTVGTIAVDSANSQLDVSTAYSFQQFSTDTGQKLLIGPAGTEVTGALSATSSVSATKVYTYGGLNYAYRLVSPGHASNYLCNIVGQLDLSAGGYYLGGNTYQLDAGNTAGSSIRLSSAGDISFFNAIGAASGGTPTFTRTATLDAAGNVGVGVTPSASWVAGSKAIQLGITGSLFYDGNLAGTVVGQNMYQDGAASFKYLYTGIHASRYIQSGGGHTWQIAPPGTAGAPISFTQVMTLTDTQLSLGTGSTNGVSGGTTSIIVDSGSGVGGGFQFIGRRNAVNSWNIGHGSAINGTHGLVNYIYGVDTWSVWVNAVKVIDINHSTALTLQGATSSAGTGISFPSTQFASSDPNTLDDYEEGTWTPSQGAGLTVVGTFSSSGTYTKIGRQVFVVGRLDATTSIATTATMVLCEALPFATVSVGTGTATNSTVGAGIHIAASASTVLSGGVITATPTIYFSCSYIV